MALSRTFSMPNFNWMHVDSQDKLVKAVQEFGRQTVTVVDQSLSTLFAPISKGLYRVSMRQLKPHAFQREHESTDITEMQRLLAEADNRMNHPIFVFIPTEIWFQLKQVQMQPGGQVSDLPVWQLPPGLSAELTILTHGRRRRALIEGLAPTSQFQSIFQEVYGEELWWPAYLVPSAVLEQLPEALVVSLMLKDNRIDPHKTGLSESLRHIAFIIAYHHAFVTLFCKDNIYRPLSPLKPELAGLLARLQQAYNLSSAQYHHALAHPTVLNVLMHSTKLVPATRWLDSGAKLDRIFQQGIWPVVAFLEVAVVQLAAFERKTNHPVLELVSEKSSYAKALSERHGESWDFSFLEKQADAGFVFSFLGEDKPWDERRYLMSSIIKKMKAWTTDYPPHLVTLLREGPEENIRLMHRGDEPQWVLWLRYFGREHVKPLHDDFRSLAVVVQLIIWIIMGPDAANRLYSSRPPQGKFELGQVPWWRSPDTIILVFLASVRQLAIEELPNPKFPPDGHCIAQVYATAHPQDLDQLYRLAGSLLFYHQELVTAVQSCLHHEAEDGSRFMWRRGEPYEVQLFAGGALKHSPPIKTSAGWRAEQRVENFAHAVQNLLGHPRWRYLVVDILELDKLVNADLMRLFNDKVKLPPAAAFSEAASGRGTPEMHDMPIETEIPRKPTSPHVPSPPCAPSPSSMPSPSPMPSPPRVSSSPEPQTESRPTTGGEKVWGTYQEPKRNTRKRPARQSTPSDSSDEEEDEDEDEPPRKRVAGKGIKVYVQVPQRRTSGDDQNSDSSSESPSQEKKAADKGKGKEVTISATQDDAPSLLMRLDDVPFPLEAPSPSQSLTRWVNAPEAERDVVIANLAQAFNPKAMAYVQAAESRIMALFQRVMDRFGTNPSAWEYAVQRLDDLVAEEEIEMDQGGRDWSQIERRHEEEEDEREEEDEQDG
ncbi:hypothetical protein BN946_scf184589.g1, partial [Trametes cinnabarina]